MEMRRKMNFTVSAIELAFVEGINSAYQQIMLSAPENSDRITIGAYSDSSSPVTSFLDETGNVIHLASTQDIAAPGTLSAFDDLIAHRMTTTWSDGFGVVSIDENNEPSDVLAILAACGDEQECDHQIDADLIDDLPDLPLADGLLPLRLFVSETDRMAEFVFERAVPVLRNAVPAALLDLIDSLEMPEHAVLEIHRSPTDARRTATISFIDLHEETGAPLRAVMSRPMMLRAA